MAKKKNDDVVNTESFVETIVVGAGPAGLTTARRLQAANPDMQILVLEAGERSGGKALSGLHLIDAVSAENFSVLSSTALEPARIRWERNWIASADVDWEAKDWIGEIPQWKLYLEGTKKSFMGIPQSDLEVAIKSQTPVSKLSPLNDSQAAWKLETPEHSYLCKRVVWAAGLTAFQNAVGKHEAQEFFVANPHFNPKAQDFRGGIGFEIAFSEAPQFAEEISTEAVLALPVKHGGVRYLILGAFETTPESLVLKTLTHVHQDTLVDPKEVMSLQKSIRRAVHALFVNFDEKKNLERWVVSTRVGGHSLGSPWLLGEGVEGSLQFVGEESVAASRNGLFDTLAALDSVNEIADAKIELGASANEMELHEADILATL